MSAARFPAKEFSADISQEQMQGDTTVKVPPPHLAPGHLDVLRRAGRHPPECRPKTRLIITIHHPASRLIGPKVDCDGGDFGGREGSRRVGVDRTQSR